MLPSLQAADHGSSELADGRAVPAVRSSAVPGQLRAAADPHPPAPGAALPAVHAAALPGPARTAAGMAGKPGLCVPGCRWQTWPLSPGLSPARINLSALISLKR